MFQEKVGFVYPITPLPRSWECFKDIKRSFAPGNSGAENTEVFTSRVPSRRLPDRKSWFLHTLPAANVFNALKKWYERLCLVGWIEPLCGQVSWCFMFHWWFQLVAPWTTKHRNWEDIWTSTYLKQVFGYIGGGLRVFVGTCFYLQRLFNLFNCNHLGIIRKGPAENER